MLAPRTRIRLVWLATLFTATVLVVIAFGISTDFYDLRLGLVFGFFALSALAFLLGYPAFGVMGIAMAILFNPVVPLHIPRYIWTIIDTLALAGILYFAHWATNPYKKGTRFEQYVASLFPEPDFALVDRTRDISKFSGRPVESDTHPDLVIRNKRTGEMRAIECKWRGSWARGNMGDTGLWWKVWQGERYAAYEKASGIPVCVAFGIGGTPEKPKEVYFHKLAALRHGFLTQSFVRSGTSCF